ETAESPGPRPSGTVPLSLFEASCRLADLALAEPLPLFRNGACLILDALRAARGCAFVWSQQDDRLDLAGTVGGDEGLGAGDPEPVRSAASRCMRTGERLRLPPGTAGAPPGGLTCVPVRDQESTVGVLCLSATSVEGSPAPEDRRGADGLAGILAHLYRAAVRRLRDPAPRAP
ncbi:MAG: GAF domain-containing protein, partial [Planctomycetota bacterium]|nr:GAF domain-containing protein [Planctomycetota bacterium]